MNSLEFKKEFTKLFNLSYPMLFAQLSLAGLGVVDTIMSGWVGRDDLAAIGLGSSFFLPVFMLSTGILLSITPIVGKYFGENNHTRISLTLSQGLWLAIPLGIASAFLIANSDKILSLLTISETVYNLTHDYTSYIAWGIPGVILYQALRFFWEGFGTTLPTMYISFFALLLNIPLNFIFIYGIEGLILPMGAAGCGVATSIVMWLMLFIAYIYLWHSPKMSHILKLAMKQKPSWNYELKRILSMGIPNALSILFSVGLFSFISLFIASFGTVGLASNQIVVSYTSVTFMIPLSISIAITIRISQAYGSKDLLQFKTALIVGFIINIFVGLLLVGLTLIGRNFWGYVYSNDIEVIKLTIILLGYAASYQIFDAIQATATGALRGIGDTKYLMYTSFISYWMISAGIGYLAASTYVFNTPMEVEGYWLGIVIGIIMATTLLVTRVFVKYREIKNYFSL